MGQATVQTRVISEAYVTERSGADGCRRSYVEHGKLRYRNVVDTEHGLPRAVTAPSHLDVVDRIPVCDTSGSQIHDATSSLCADELSLPRA